MPQVRWMEGERRSFEERRSLGTSRSKLESVCEESSNDGSATTIIDIDEATRGVRLEDERNDRMKTTAIPPVMSF
eukprot:CAMPEP_0179194424 /NCGR_PEP_ID=MMETSP0796-20121207/96631_1 /TAXON_ID=73915 /ORGANISM="Pyrodinium bahamense, Strain pbaha01" /LENGTH=74 /DNA_ID=CAMNT_0020898751 /DNA_START=1 /DNA_END=225 /DNA_ORIENTATION=+